MENTQQIIKDIKSGKVEFADLEVSYRANREVAIAAVSTNGINLPFCAGRLKWDKEIVNIAVERTPGAIIFVSKYRKDYRSLVLKALTKNGSLIHFTPKEIKCNKKLALAAVSQYGEALEYVSDRLKNDKEVVLAALRQSEGAETFISTNLLKKLGNHPRTFLERETLNTSLNQNLASNSNVSHKKTKI